MALSSDNGLSRYRKAAVMAALLICCNWPAAAGVDDAWNASPTTNDTQWAQANSAPVNPGNSGTTLQTLTVEGAASACRGYSFANCPSGWKVLSGGHRWNGSCGCSEDNRFTVSSLPQGDWGWAVSQECSSTVAIAICTPR